MVVTYGKMKNPIDFGGSRVNSDHTTDRFVLLWLSYIVSVITSSHSNQVHSRDPWWRNLNYKTSSDT